jgi:hypothetical protein
MHQEAFLREIHKSYIPFIIAAIYDHSNTHWHPFYLSFKFQVDTIVDHRAIVLRDASVKRSAEASPAWKSAGIFRLARPPHRIQPWRISASG